MVHNWTPGQLAQLIAEMRNDQPLYVFVDESDNVLDTEQFPTLDEAVDHARKLPAPVVNVLLYVGCAENLEERTHVGTRREV